ncbi:10299_t:CDS:2, partial [Gigaspora rosea]
MEWKSEEDKELQQLWKGNLACRVLVKARELKVSFGVDENWWCIYGRKYPIRNLLQEEKGSSKFDKWTTGYRYILFESKLLQDEGRRTVKEEWRKRERAGSKENHRKKKVPGKSFQYLERQEESGSSKSAKWLTKSRILSCLPRPVVKEGKHVCLIPTDMLEEM